MTQTMKVQQLSDVSVKQAAKMLDVCPLKLFDFLRTQNIFNSQNIPHDKYCRQGFFRSKLLSISKSTGSRFMRTHAQPRVTAAGLGFISELLDGNPEKAQAIRRRNSRAGNQKTAPRSTESSTRTTASAR